MTLHLGFELPKKPDRRLDEHTNALTDEEARILRAQIKSNSRVIQELVDRLDLLVNKEKYPCDIIFVEKIRRRLFLLMEENDTFRRVLWRAEAGISLSAPVRAEEDDEDTHHGEAA